MSKKILISAILLFLAAFSAFIAWGVILTPESYNGLIAMIDNNVNQVLQLTGASTAASAAITLIPGDVATPIAMKLADFSTYFLFVLCVLYLEKFLMGASGYAALVWIFPIACGFGIAAQLTGKRILHNAAAKIGILGIAVLLIIPGSVKISDKVYQMYRPNIEQTLASATDISNMLEDTVEEQNEETGFLESLTNTVTEKFSLAIDSAEQLISRFIEALAIMIVVSCLIPVIVLLMFYKLIKVLFGIRIPAYMFGKRSGSYHDKGMRGIPHAMRRRASAGEVEQHTRRGLEDRDR